MALSKMHSLILCPLQNYERKLKKGFTEFMFSTHPHLSIIYFPTSKQLGRALHNIINQETLQKHTF